LYVNGLTIANGHYDNPRAFGGGGGCICSKGNVFLNYSAVSSCYLSSSVYAAGGGISAFHTVSLYRSSVTGNTVHGNDANATGGGIQAYEVELYRSTVSGNTASYSGTGPPSAAASVRMPSMPTTRLFPGTERRPRRRVFRGVRIPVQQYRSGNHADHGIVGGVCEIRAQIFNRR
jgi:hypothetical protein